MKAWRDIEKFFWRPSAVIGIIWGIISVIILALGGGLFTVPKLFYSFKELFFFPAWFVAALFWNSPIPDILHNIFYKTFHTPNIPQLTYVLLSTFTAVIICVSIDHLISKLIKEVKIR